MQGEMFIIKLELEFIRTLTHRGHWTFLYIFSELVVNSSYSAYEKNFL